VENIIELVEENKLWGGNLEKRLPAPPIQQTEGEMDCSAVSIKTLNFKWSVAGLVGGGREGPFIGEQSKTDSAKKVTAMIASARRLYGKPAQT